MKKTILFIAALAVATLLSCSGNQKDQSGNTAEEVTETGSPTVDILTDELGGVDSVYYDSEGRVTRIAQTGLDVYGEKKNAVTDDLAYSAYGKLIRVLHREERGQASPLVTEHLFTYDHDGLLATVTSRIVGRRKGEPSKTVITYGNRRQVKDIVTGKAVVECTYDDEGRLESETVTDKDENDELIKDEAWTFVYDSLGHCTEVLAVVKKNVGLLNEDTVHNVYQYVYDQKGRPVKEVNCESVAIGYNYDSRGRQLNCIVTVAGEHGTTAVSSQAPGPRPHLYRQRGSDDHRSPFCLTLGAISLTLDWFNSQEE